MPRSFRLLHKFPEHAEAFIAVRAAQGLRLSSVIAPLEDRPVQVTRVNNEDDLPPYTKDDPEPMATMQLYQQLADEGYFGGADLAYVVSGPSPRYEAREGSSPGPAEEAESSSSSPRHGRWRALLVPRRFSI